jgi:hypothetical protein
VIDGNNKMPSKSKKQHNLMALVANDSKAARRLGIPSSVGKEFMDADKGKKFKGGGMMDKKDMAQDKKMAKKAVGMHEKQLHGGKKSDLAKLKSGGMTKMKAGGSCYSKGGQLAKANGIAVKGKTKGTMVAMRSGGKTKSKMC